MRGETSIQLHQFHLNSILTELDFLYRDIRKAIITLSFVQQKASQKQYAASKDWLKLMCKQQ